MIFNPEDFSSKNHAATLSTIITIEDFIMQNSGVYSKTELWNNLPKKIMYQSYKIILEYLIFSSKIQTRGKKVFWICKTQSFDLSKFSAQSHNPTLTTISLVETFLKENSGIYSKTEAWNNLPKKIMYQTYKIILAYLENSNKISVTNKKLILQNFGGENQ